MSPTEVGLREIEEGEPMQDFVATECAIRQLHARYADAVWRKDANSFGADTTFVYE